MNGGPDQPDNGFAAAWIGDRAFAELPWELFFPVQRLGTFQPSDPAAEWPEVTVGDLIRPEKIGDLCDDAGQFEERREEALHRAPQEEEPKEEEETEGPKPPVPVFVDFLLIPIGRNSRGEIVRYPTLFSSDLEPAPPFLAELSVRLSGGIKEDRGANPKVKLAGRLQVGHLYLEFGRRLAKEKRSREGNAVVNIDICRSLEAYLETELSVYVPLSAWDILCKLARFQSVFASGEEFRGYLKDVRAWALSRWPEFRELYPGVAPLTDQDAPGP
jgi:hypothetical protein